MRRQRLRQQRNGEMRGTEKKERERETLVNKTEHALAQLSRRPCKP